MSSVGDDLGDLSSDHNQIDGSLPPPNPWNLDDASLHERQVFIKSIGVSYGSLLVRMLQPIAFRNAPVGLPA